MRAPTCPSATSSPAVPGLAIPPRPARSVLRRLRARLTHAEDELVCTSARSTHSQRWYEGARQRPRADHIRHCHAQPATPEARNPAAAQILEPVATPGSGRPRSGPARKRPSQISDDLRWYVLPEALEEHLLAGRQPQPATMAAVRACWNGSAQMEARPPPKRPRDSRGHRRHNGMAERAAYIRSRSRWPPRPSQWYSLSARPGQASHLFNLLAATGNLA